MAATEHPDRSGSGSPEWSSSPGGPPPSSAAWGPAPGRGSAPGPQRTDTKALVALVLAIASFVLLPFLAAVAALVVARMSRRDIAASGGRLGGSGLLTATRVIAWANIVLCVLAVVAVVALFSLFFAFGFS